MVEISLTEIELKEVIAALTFWAQARMTITGYHGTQFSQTVIENIQVQVQRGTK